MDEVIDRIKQTINSNIHFDLEILLDDIILAFNKEKAKNDELVFKQGQHFENKLSDVKKILIEQLNELKTSSRTVIEVSSVYRILKKILSILDFGN